MTGSAGHRTRWTGCCTGALLGLALLVSPAHAGSDPLQERITRLANGENIRIGDTTIRPGNTLLALYHGYNDQALWTNPDSVTQLVQAIRSSESDGLDPADYHLAAIESLLGKTAGDPAHVAELDLLLTDALIRLAGHLGTGKVDPTILDADWNITRRLDAHGTLLLRSPSIRSGKVDQLIESLRPQSIQYLRLRQALAQYRLYQALGGWQPIKNGTTLKTGVVDERVPALRARLIATDDLSSRDMFLPTFDEAVESAVKRFQARHGLQVDGRVGRDTLTELNIPVEERIDSIRANLERARWVLRDLPATYLMVDIAGFSARFIRDGKELWTSRAQVGQPVRKSPVFRSRLTYLDLNPTWTVPPTILDKDILPKLREDPGYLASHDMDVIDYDGSPVDENSIDWYSYNGRNFPWLIRQRAGPGNALGRIKFMFPNRYSVYLHDTPNKRLFDRPSRAFSSGCIRIERPYDLAELLLEGNPGWDRQQLEYVINTRKTRSVTLHKPVDIVLFYWTVNVDADGTVTFNRDIYQRDLSIISGLGDDYRLLETDSVRHSADSEGRDDHSG